MGFGLFNVVEGIMDHHMLGIHHVNETVPPAQWIYWDIGFLVWGALMLLGGGGLCRRGGRRPRNRVRANDVMPVFADLRKYGESNSLVVHVTRSEVIEGCPKAALTLFQIMTFGEHIRQWREERE